MDYGGIVRRALDIAWHHRWLWLLAFFAGEGATGFSFNYNVPRGGATPAPATGGAASFRQAQAQATAWIAAHIGLLVLVGVLLLAVLVVLFLLSTACEGAALGGAAELDAGRPCGLGRAWGFGVAVFWPMLGLRLLVLLIGLGLFLVAAGVLAVAIFSGVAAHAIGATVLLAWQWLGLIGVLFVIALVGPTLVRLAERAVALDRARPAPALGVALRLLRRRLGPVAVLWVIELACTIGVGIAIFVVFLALAVPAFVGGYLAFQHPSAAGIAVLALYGALVLAAFVVAAAAVSAFFSTYWTVGYRRLVAISS